MHEVIDLCESNTECPVIWVMLKSYSLILVMFVCLPNVPILIKTWWNLQYEPLEHVAWVLTALLKLAQCHPVAWPSMGRACQVKAEHHHNHQRPMHDGTWRFLISDFYCKLWCQICDFTDGVTFPSDLWSPASHQFAAHNLEISLNQLWWLYLSRHTSY